MWDSGKLQAYFVKNITNIYNNNNDYHATAQLSRGLLAIREIISECDELLAISMLRVFCCLRYSAKANT